MKNLYQCEKCGKTFADFDECYKHENMHWTITSAYWREFEKASEEMTEYDMKHEAPSIVGVELERYDEETGKQVHAVARYVLKDLFLSDRLTSDEQRHEDVLKEEEEQH